MPADKSHTLSWTRTPVLLVLAVGFALALSARPPSATAQFAEGPSEFCHVTDGTFTICPDESEEWSDIAPTVQPETGGVVFASQADLVDNSTITPENEEAGTIVFTPDGELDHLMLMYESSRTVPLGPDEYVLVHFMTVDEKDENPEALLHYAVRIFGDATIQVFVDGEERGPGGRQEQIDTMRGATGFAPSPTNATPHILSEFQIGLAAAGFETCCYSPDPAWWSSVAPSCTVDINPKPATMNFGQFAQFTATVTGGSVPIAYKWSIDPDIIKDYQESVALPFSTTAMQQADFQNQTIAFYWKPAPGTPDGPRQVSVVVTAGGDTCTDKVTVNVEKNTTDITKQAEDYYTSNHGGIVRANHQNWHLTHQGGTGGELFFSFHRAFLDRFSSWRNEFGYPKLVVWVSGTQIPTGVEIDHPGRNPSAQNKGAPKPGYLTIPGGSTNTLANCAPGITGGGETMLINFNADQEFLGCVTERNWHNGVHVSIGGDMKTFLDAVKDPIFWRWHEYVDTVRADRASLTPPGVLYQTPFRLFTFITELPSVGVTFGEPVVGVAAGDLTVNGSPASSVVGAGEGPYVFTGYAPPALGPVAVQLATGNIEDLAAEAFPGDSWDFTLIDPALDADNDGANDGDEANIHLTDPTNPDTDGDGLPDGFEIDNDCLEPLFDQANPEDHEGNQLPGNDDADNDGLTDLQEFVLGSDPCSFIFVAGNNAMRAGFDANVLPANDDSSTGPVAIGFTPDFFGTDYSSLFVNNNGNVTFDSPLGDFTPFDLNSTGRVIIAPFFADVDTRAGDVLTYGTGTVDGHPAFGVTWPGVGCFSQITKVLNFFQVLLIDRSDVAPGDFDIEFNYDSIQWEAGEANGGNANCQGGTSARAGFASGTGEPGTSFELPGSGINGAFVDANTDDGLIHNSLGSEQLGRYVIPVRTGTPIPADGDEDGIADAEDNCPATENEDQQDSNIDGIGDACQATTPLETTAFLQASLDGTTGAEATDPAAGEPELEEQILRIVQFQIDQELTSDFHQLTKNLVASQVDLGLLTPQEAQALIESIIAQLTPALLGDVSCDGVINSIDPLLILQLVADFLQSLSCESAADVDLNGSIDALDALIILQFIAGLISSLPP